jgi:RAT1-interacting protein
LPRPWAECSREEIEDRDAQVVDTHAQYCSIVRTGIGNHTIVLGGEVDCVKGEKPDDGSGHSIPYVELKTSESFNGHDSRAAEKFEKKMCRFWAQSFLLGVPTIIIGFRSSHGILEGVEEWETQRIPGFVQNRGMRTWDGNVCINFAAAFLDFLKQTISSAPSGEDGTWLIKRRKGAKEITITRTSEVLDPQIVTPAFRMHRENLKPSLDSEPTAS